MFVGIREDGMDVTLYSFVPVWRHRPTLEISSSHGYDRQLEETTHITDTLADL